MQPLNLHIFLPYNCEGILPPTYSKSLTNHLSTSLKNNSDFYTIV